MFPCSTNGGEEERINVIDGKSKVKKPPGRRRRRWVVNIKMNLGVVEWGDVDFIGLDQDGDKWRAVVNAVMNLRVP
jgi:hypothetical protein